MLLVVDIGNSNISSACWFDNQRFKDQGTHNESIECKTANNQKTRRYWSKIYRTESSSTESSAETFEEAPTETPTENSVHAIKIFNYFQHIVSDSNERIDAAVIGSVVPNLTEQVVSAIRQTCTHNIFLAHTHTPSPLSEPPPQEIGQDLFANAIASFCKSNIVLSKSVIIGTPRRPEIASITVDMGTALTFTSVDGKGKIVGVAIFPGLETAYHALVGRAAQITHSALEMPRVALATNTQDALNSGLMLGFGHLIRGMVAQLKTELARATQVYATGGNSALMKTLAPPLDNTFDDINPYHTLEGLRELYVYNLDERENIN